MSCMSRIATRTTRTAFGVAALVGVLAAGCATGSPPRSPTPSVAVAPTAPAATFANPTRSPNPMPTPVATPSLAASPTASPTLAASRLVTHGSRTSNAVALTYDMGGRIGDAVAITQWLVAHRVHATIFVTGAMADNVNTDAGRVVLGIVDDHPELFALANHSYTHRDFRTLTAAEIDQELRRTEAAIAPWCSQDLHPIFRPPSGGYDAAVLAAVGASGYPLSVTWDVDTIDWRPVVNDPPGPTTDDIVAKVLTNARGGSIVLNHLGGYNTLAALPRVVSGLQAAGYDLVTLDELLGT